MSYQLNQKKEDFWNRHLQQAKTFEGSDKQYCKENGLNHHTFSYWKQKVSARSKTKSASPFIPVTVATNAPVTKEMPDAKWVAEVLFELYQRFQ